jgi:opacity protein-like surface antigen
MKTKTILLMAGALLAPSAVRSADVGPYVSEKASYSMINAKDLSLGASGGWENRGKDMEDKVLGNRLAVGFATPIDAIGGTIRVELEWGVNGRADGKSGMVGNPSVGTGAKIKASGLTLNGYYDVITGTPLVPYVGFGLGYAKIDVESDSYGAMPAGYSIKGGFGDANFAWNVGFGAGCALNDRLSLDAGYRYTDLGKVKGDLKYDEAGTISVVVEKGGLSSHEVVVGARYGF